MSKVVVYTSTTCAYCKPVKTFLKNKEVEYEERNIENMGYAAQLQKLTGLLTVPVVVINKMPIAGIDYRRMSNALKEAGLI